MSSRLVYCFLACYFASPLWAYDECLDADRRRRDCGSWRDDNRSPAR